MIKPKDFYPTVKIKISPDSENGVPGGWYAARTHSPEASVLGEAVIHFQLTFDARYPVSAPECRLFTPLPHLNVRKDLPLAAAPYRVSIWDCSPSEQGWTAAYTVHSVLLLLPVILFDEDLLHRSGSRLIHESIKTMIEYQCRACPHSGKHTKPCFSM